MEFKKYQKILSYLDKDGNIREECEGILNGVVYVQEKIDGANLSVWMQDGEIHIGSRNQDVTNSSFRGAVEYIKNHEGIKEFFKVHPTARLYGEWLVPHTITNYSPENYNHFYLFDIELLDCFLNMEAVYDTSISYNIKAPHLFGVFNNPTYEEILKFAGESKIGPFGEGVVIKNPGFINKFYVNQYSKIVTEAFKEDNGVIFGNHSKDDKETRLTTKLVTEARIRKIINKIEQNEDKDISKTDIGKIIKLTYYDILTEEIMTIMKEGTVNFTRLNKKVGQKTGMLASQIISGQTISVAFNKE